MIEGARDDEHPEERLPINDAEDFRGGLARVHIGGEYEDLPHNLSEWKGGAWHYINTVGEIIFPYKSTFADP